MRTIIFVCYLAVVLGGCGETEWVEVKQTGGSSSGYEGLSDVSDGGEVAAVGENLVSLWKGSAKGDSITVTGYSLIDSAVVGNSVYALSTNPVDTLIKVSRDGKNLSSTHIPSLGGTIYGSLHYVGAELYAAPSEGRYLMKIGLDLAVPVPVEVPQGFCDTFHGAFSWEDGVFMLGVGAVVVYNGTTGGFESWAVEGGGAWKTGVVTGGVLYGAPWEGEGILSCEVKDGNCTVIPLPSMVQYGWSGVDVLGGYLVFSPYNAPSILLYDLQLATTYLHPIPAPAPSAYSNARTSHATTLLSPYNATSFLAVTLCPTYRKHSSDGGVTIGLVIVTLVLGLGLVFGTLYYYTHVKKDVVKDEEPEYISYDHDLSEMNIVVN